MTATIEHLLSAKGCFVPIIAPDARIADAVRLLEIEHAGALVVTGDGREIDGMISEGDVVRGLQWYGPDVLRHCVRDLMTGDVTTCAANDRISDVMTLMGDRMVRHVPVVVAGKLAGIVTVRDILRFWVDDAEAETDAAVTETRRQ